MAKRAVTQIIDDLDGKVLTEDEAQTIRFGINGVNYQIDLSLKNAKQFQKKVDFYIERSRVLKTEKRTTAKTRQAVTLAPLTASSIRHWASDNGFSVSDRGRIPIEIRKAYEAAH